MICDHLLHWPAGGFIGVDVFFVISGFLITGLLIKEHSRKGRISFVDFYKRRIRRIMPLAVLVLLVTMAAAWLVLNAGRARIIAEDGLWAMAFAANWHFALSGTDYMNVAGPVSPLQHFWSLAVEEQFYVVWPVLIVLVLGGLAGRFGWSHQTALRTLTWVMAVVVVGSLAFALWETASSPTVAYFSTFSRSWELGLGALLAVCAKSLARIPDLLRPYLSYLGLAGIAWSLFFITPDMPFPGPWAIVPVLSSCLVIAAGTGGPARAVFPLTTGVAGYLGDISYSLYLWHFPVIIFAESLMPVEEPVTIAIVLAIIAGLSVLSFHLLEDPIRKSSWLDPAAAKKRHSHRISPKLAAQITGVVALFIVTAVAGAYSLNLYAAKPSEAANASLGPKSKAPAVDAKTAETALAAQIRTALDATAWPELSPSIESLGRDTQAREWAKDGCLGKDVNSLPDPMENAARCVYGDAKAKKTAVLLGDSVAISWLPGLRAALEPKGYKILVYTLQECPAIKIPVLHGVNDALAPHPECTSFHNNAYAKMRDIKPDAIFMSSVAGTTARLASGSKGPASLQEWSKAAQASFTELAAAAKQVVVLSPPPGGKNLQQCATRISKPADCVTSPDSIYFDTESVERQAAAAATAAGKGKVTLASTKSWFCSPRNSCPAFIGTTPVYADVSHLNYQFAEKLGPVLAQTVSGVTAAAK
ncbi:hypothetical protein BIU82_09430 [Arthrobacter sp. SW1]|nr:hypothetical protein BIU82_09430 [Arthrobacter sp. SW1]